MLLAAAIVLIAVMWLAPPLIWIALTRWLCVSWRFMLLGAATWLSALPLLVLVPVVASIVIAPDAVVWGVALSLAAGIGEESSRFLYYRFSATMRDVRSGAAAVVVGAGHGGTESIVLGLQSLLGVIMLFYFPSMIPAEIREQASTAYFLLSALSRLMILVIHVGFSILVWRAVSRRQIGYFFLAVTIHIAIDLAGFAAPTIWPGHGWIGWAAVTLAFAGAIWLIWQTLRRTGTRAEGGSGV